jgi:large subunit ribosomal protein L30
MAETVIKVKQVRGMSGHPQKMRRVLRALGLGKINREVEHKDNNCTRGMINKVIHLVKYELISK